MRFVCLKQPFEFYLIDSVFKNVIKLSRNAHRLELIKQPLCQTLANAFDISKKTDLTLRARFQLDASEILCVIASN